MLESLVQAETQSVTGTWTEWENDVRVMRRSEARVIITGIRFSHHGVADILTQAADVEAAIVEGIRNFELHHSRGLRVRVEG